MKLMAAPYLLIAVACGGGNAAQRPDCPAGQTSLDGTCVSQQVADYVGCIRATGATVASDSAKSLSAAAGVAGVTGSTQADVKDKLEKSYATVSDANALEIIHNCYSKTSTGVAASATGSSQSAAFPDSLNPTLCPDNPSTVATGNSPAWDGRTCRLITNCAWADLKQCTESCAAGSPTACDTLAAMYWRGLGVSRNDMMAAQFARKACGGRSAMACNTLGYLYETGVGVERDDVRAATLYQSSCDAGNAWGCNNLGRAYDSGRGVQADPQRAVDLWRRACDLKLDHACANLGHALVLGRGIAPDRQRGLQLLHLACSGMLPTAEEHKNASACDWLREVGETP